MTLHLQPGKQNHAYLSWPASLALVMLVGCVNAAETATPPSVSRKDLLTVHLGPGTVFDKVEIKEVTLSPGVKAPLHLHPCPVTGVVREGTISFQIDGQPVQQLKAGDAFYEPANVRVARFDNDGKAPAKFTALYLLGSCGQELVRLLPE